MNGRVVTSCMGARADQGWPGRRDRAVGSGCRMRRLRPRLAEDSFLVLLKYTGKNLCHVVYFFEDIVRDVEVCRP